MPQPPCTPTTPENVPRPRWLIVVRGDRQALHRHLREGFGVDSRVEIIVDRRHADWEKEVVPLEVDQEGQQRRRSMTAQEQSAWEQLGFLLIHRGDDLRIYEARREPSGPPLPAAVASPP